MMKIKHSQLTQMVAKAFSQRSQCSESENIDITTMPIHSWISTHVPLNIIWDGHQL